MTHKLQRNLRIVGPGILSFNSLRKVIVSNNKHGEYLGHQSVSFIERGFYFLECPLLEVLLLILLIFSRDRSACASLRRVCSNSTGSEAQDQWLEFYFRPESEPEFPLRNKQVDTSSIYSGLP